MRCIHLLQLIEVQIEYIAGAISANSTITIFHISMVVWLHRLHGYLFESLATARSKEAERLHLTSSL